ncbi:hypothetical protein Tco_0404083 [Tanacetum coccineum]
MQESKPPKKIKKRVQVQMSIDEELAKKVFQEEQAKFKAKQEQEKFDFETALELQKKLDEREEVTAKEAYDIDWSDPSVLRYHALQNRPFSVAEVRKNMCMYLKNQESVQEQPSEEPKADELSQEQLQQMMIIVPKEGMHIEALEDLDKLWRLVKEIFNSPGLTDDKEKELWVELKRLFEPDGTDTL